MAEKPVQCIWTILFSLHSHLQRLGALLEWLAGAKLTINLAKCEFARGMVTYLGCVVGQGNVGPVQFWPHEGTTLL